MHSTFGLKNINYFDEDDKGQLTSGCIQVAGHNSLTHAIVLIISYYFEYEAYFSRFSH